MIKQVQQQAQQEAQQYVGSVVNFAEQAHINKLREDRTKTDHAEKEATPSTPDRRGKAKANTGPSPKSVLPPFPTGETASGSQDQPTYDAKQKAENTSRPRGRPTKNPKAENDNPEPSHEPKGPRGRPSHTQPKTEKEKGPPTVKQKQTPKKKTPNMIPIGTLVNQKRTGTSKSEDMLLISCLKEDGSGRDQQVEKMKKQFARVTETTTDMIKDN